MWENMICPNCESDNVVKRGKGKRKQGNIQIYYCNQCKKRFSRTTLKHKKHHAKIIYHAMNMYNQGYTLQKCSSVINQRYKCHLCKSTIHSWVHEFHDLCPIVSLRQNFSPDEDVVMKKRFEHENLDYEFMYHRYKLDMLAREQFPGLYAYITRFEQGCPDVFFEVGKRCSQPLFEVYVDAVQKKNLACKMATFVIKAVQENRERHTLVEQFMVINDTATVACEVPVWYWEKQADTGITGHIDLIQVRNNLVYILDYKPDATHDRKAPWQLYHYAMALSFRTKIPLHRMRCAWFDEHTYFEYNPSKTQNIPRNLNTQMPRKSNNSYATGTERSIK